MNSIEGMIHELEEDFEEIVEWVGIRMYYEIKRARLEGARRMARGVRLDKRDPIDEGNKTEPSHNDYLTAGWNEAVREVDQKIEAVLEEMGDE